ncbi:ATP-binding cassette domain-containing protein [Actinotignum urinale]|uniref:metal ABC transporter ATP-binding protein n=1 Tax=Actinotignum urinale TaxID=190146 RepID=UPI002A83B963|nr:ATP-binding cassette domain-containing protein [Actinotignum urinale]MDY5151843.1 ATP-binding cassette domain-containing protein [Actinotignum urinale]
MIANPALSLDSLCVRYGNKRVVDNASFSIYSGELVGLIGPNGAGKTTLMRAILGLVRPSQGVIRSDGAFPGYVPQRQDVAWDYPISVVELVLMGLRKEPLWRRLVGVMSGGQKRSATRVNSDKTSILGGNTTKDNVAPKAQYDDATPRGQHNNVTSSTSREAYRAARHALEAVNMLEFANRPIGALSGGQRQRILIARALIGEPAVLLLDEPFTGLDQPTQDSLSQLFRDLANNGTAVIMSTHDLAQAVHVCDRLIMLSRSVRAIGTPHELRDPQLWMDTYSVGADSPLLRSVGLLT